MALAFRVRYDAEGAGIQGERIVPQLPIRFGRNSLNQVQISHGYVSDFHAIVELLDNKLCVRDLNSKNGVFLPTGQRLTPTVPTPIDSAGDCSFVLGGAVRVKVEAFARELQVGQERASETSGSVIGNREFLRLGNSGLHHPSQPNPFAPPPAGASFVAQPPLMGPSIPQPAGAPYLPPLPPVQGQPPQAHPERGPLPGQDARGGPATQHLTVSVEAMAHLGLRELASSLVPGVPLQTSGDVARLLTKLHDTIEMYCRCLVPLREGYTQFVSSMDLQRAASQRSLNRSKSALRVEQARDPAALAAALLDWRNQDYDAPQVVEQIFAEVMMHQVALVDGIMRGVQALLEELSPARIERLFEENGPSGVSAMLGKHRALWQTFVAHHEELQNETRLFEVVFGQDFAESYRQYLSRRGGTTR